MIFRNNWRDPQGKLQQSKNWSYAFTYDGIRYRGTCKTENKALAKQFEAERLRERQHGYAGVPLRKKAPTFADAAEAYLSSKPSWSARQRAIQTYNVAKLTPIFGRKRLTEIASDDIARFQTMCQGPGLLGPRTTNMICSTLKAILVKNELWDDPKKTYTPLTEPKDVGRDLSPDEQHRLLVACQKSRSRSLYPAWLLTTHTGLRHDETARLRWAQVDLVDRWIQVGKSKTPTGRGRRVPITDTLLGVLKQWRAQFPDAQPHHYVFPSEAYSANTSAPGAFHHVDPTKRIKSWKTAWTNARKAAGVKCRWHDGRHFYISSLCRSGVPDAIVMELVGHIDVEMLRRYSHMGNAAKRAAVAVLDKVPVTELTKFCQSEEDAPSVTVQ